MNQLVLAGIAAAVVAAGAFTAGWRVNGWRHDAQDKHDQELVQKASEAMATSAATEIGKIEVRNVTIRQQAETVTREVPVYRDGTCNHDDRMYNAINQALTEPSPDPGGVPSPGTAH